MKTFHVALCEDESPVLDYLTVTLKKSLTHPNTNFEFDSYTKPQDLLTAMCNGKEYDIFFLDIEMPQMDGIELSHRIRALTHDVLVIFISNKEEMVFKSFEVQPFRFIRKNHFQQELPSLVTALRQQIQKQNSNHIHITIDASKKIYSFNPNDVLYIEVLGKYCNFVTKSGTQRIRYKISDLVETLRPYGFLHTHRSYLVNCRYIYNIGTNSITLDTHQELPLSRNRTKEVKEFFMQYAKGE